MTTTTTTFCYGQALIERLEAQRKTIEAQIENRRERIDRCQTDEDDCFISMKVDSDSLSQIGMKLHILRNGGTSWFVEYATLDDTIIEARWCNTKYGTKLRAVMPNGEIIWTSSDTAKGLAKRGLKRVLCKRPAWVRFYASASGMMGVMTGSYGEFPSDVNYATGEPASTDPIEMRDYEENSCQ